MPQDSLKKRCAASGPAQGTPLGASLAPRSLLIKWGLLDWLQLVHMLDDLHALCAYFSAIQELLWLITKFIDVFPSYRHNIAMMVLILCCTVLCKRIHTCRITVAPLPKVTRETLLDATQHRNHCPHSSLVSSHLVTNRLFCCSTTHLDCDNRVIPDAPINLAERALAN